MHNDEIKQALFTLVQAAYEHGIVTRQEVRDYDPGFESETNVFERDWDRAPAPAYPVTGPEQDDPTWVRYDGETIPLDEAVAYAGLRGYVKPDHMTWEDAARYLRDLGYDVWLDYGTTTMTMVEPETEDNEDFGYLDEDEPETEDCGYLDYDDEPEVAFPEDESTIVAIGHDDAFYHPRCAVEEAIDQGEASPAARDMTLADLYPQIEYRLLGGIRVVTEITEVEGEDCGHCGAVIEAPQTEGGVITFSPGEVTLYPETGVFERTTTTEDISITYGPTETVVAAAPRKSGFFRRIFG